MIDFRSRVEYTGEGAPNEATEFLKGFKGIVTGKSAFITEDESFVEVTFIDDGGTRIVNVANLRDIDAEIKSII